MWLICATAAPAHEFWIEPQSFAVAPGGEIVADIKVGQDLVGEAFPFIRELAVDDGFRGAEGRRPLGGRTGDLPAIRETADGPGLGTLWMTVLPNIVVHTEWESFAEYARYEGIEWVLDRHLERGRPREGIYELFSRSARALVDVGEGGGEDRPAGLPLELVAGANPYALEPETEGLPVTLLWQGEPLAGAQVRVFRKMGGEEDVEIVELRTDAGGRALVPLGAGGVFLLNAVHIIEYGGPPPRPDWHSFWTTLTFAVEGR